MLSIWYRYLKKDAADSKMKLTESAVRYWKFAKKEQKAHFCIALKPVFSKGAGRRLHFSILYGGECRLREGTAFYVKNQKEHREKT